MEKHKDNLTEELTNLNGFTPNILIENLIQDLREQIACLDPTISNYDDGQCDAYSYAIEKLEELINE